MIRRIFKCIIFLLKLLHKLNVNILIYLYIKCYHFKKSLKPIKYLSEKPSVFMKCTYLKHLYKKCLFPYFIYNVRQLIKNIKLYANSLIKY